MEKIVDIYVNKKNNKWIGRMLVEDDDTFEGVAYSEEEGEERTFLYGTIGEETQNITHCSKKSISYIFKENINKSIVRLDCQDTTITLIPAELTRETTEFELVRLRLETELLKEELTGRTKEEYEKFKRRGKKQLQKVK